MIKEKVSPLGRLNQIQISRFLQLLILLLLLSCNNVRLGNEYLKTHIVLGEIEKNECVVTGTMNLGEADFDIAILDDRKLTKVVSVTVSGTQNRVPLVNFYEIIDSTIILYKLEFIGRTNEEGLITLPNKVLERGVLVSMLGFRKQKIVLVHSLSNLPND